jgi:hypothetical protein
MIYGIITFGQQFPPARPWRYFGFSMEKKKKKKPPARRNHEAPRTNMAPPNSAA